MNERVVIIGASGLVGKHLMEFLELQGCEVIPVSRSKRDGWRVLEPACIEGASVVINLAGETVNQRWTESAKHRILNSRVDLTKDIALWIRDLEEGKRPHTWINASAIGFYGEGGDQVFNEESSRGETFLANVCEQWENATSIADDLTRVVHLRVGVVLAKDGDAYTKMMKPFRMGFGGKIGTGKQWLPWIHIDDLTGIFYHTIVHSEVRHAVNGTSPHPVTNAVFTKAVSDQLKKPAVCSVPAFGLKLLLGEFADLALASCRVDPKVARETNFSFKFPDIASALKDIEKNEK